MRSVLARLSALPAIRALRAAIAASSRPLPQMGAADAWALLGSDPQAVLIDVREAFELAASGQPALAATGRTLRCLPWRGNGKGFAAAAQASGLDPALPVLLICRTGRRSAAATRALLANGYARAINIAGGFDGAGGWRARGLPAEHRRG